MLLNEGAAGLWNKKYEYISKRMIKSSNKIQLSYHAKSQVGSDYNRLYDISIIDKDFLLRGNVFEVELNEENRIKKFLVRSPYNEFLDLILVCIKKYNNIFIKTAWTNDKNDNHKTLDLSKYN